MSGPPLLGNPGNPSAEPPHPPPFVAGGPMAPGPGPMPPGGPLPPIAPMGRPGAKNKQQQTMMIVGGVVVVVALGGGMAYYFGRSDPKPAHPAHEHEKPPHHK